MTQQITAKQVHLLIVTGQAQANLIPVLQLKPDIIALAISANMQSNARQFINMLKKIADYNDKQIICFDQIPDADIEAISDKAMEIEDQLHQQFPAAQITYHATGGNKLMTLGFYSVFNNGPHQIIYCDTLHGKIESLYPEKQASRAIQSVLNIQDALLSMNQIYRKSADTAWQQTAQHRKELTKWLGYHAAELDEQGFFGCINQFVQNAARQTGRGQENLLDYPEHYFRQTPRGLWKTALQKLTQNQLCQWDAGRAECLYFDSIQAAEYIGGQWLEEYTWHIIKDLNPEEVKANIEFSEAGVPKADIRNEMDCIVAHHNHLLFIECKTINFQKPTGKDTDIIYKLESLGHRASGLYGHKWLISARKLNDAALKRAKEYQIEVIYGAEVKNLKDRVQQWMAAR